MNLYRISQTVNNGWDTYSDAIVAAETEEEARHIHPGIDRQANGYTYLAELTWAPPDQVTVELIGTALPTVKAGVICASFHAG